MNAHKPVLDYLADALAGNLGDVVVDCPDVSQGKPHDVLFEIHEPARSLLMHGIWLVNRNANQVVTNGNHSRPDRDLLIGRVLTQLAWAHFFRHPELRKVGGSLMLCKDWHIGICREDKLRFPEDVFPDKHCGNQFALLCERILRGDHIIHEELYDQPAAEDALVVGEIEDTRARQLYLLSGKMYLQLERLQYQRRMFSTELEVAQGNVAKNILIYYCETLRNIRKLFLPECINVWRLPSDWQSREVTVCVRKDWCLYVPHNDE